ncbi:hypothetical protein HK102_004613 [Quaeritorhiza haematococci]|nr:hypothetical protein HK102_004613 [Quaeritorhiza haematococci]
MGVPDPPPTSNPLTSADDPAAILEAKRRALSGIRPTRTATKASLISKSDPPAPTAEGAPASVNGGDGGKGIEGPSAVVGKEQQTEIVSSSASLGGSVPTPVSTPHVQTVQSSTTSKTAKRASTASVTVPQTPNQDLKHKASMSSIDSAEMAKQIQSQLLTATNVPKTTGNIFTEPRKDENGNLDFLPAVLRPLAKKLQDSVDLVKLQIQTYRPTIELLIYWENFTSALTFTTSLLFVWFAGRWNLSFGWVVLMIIIVGGAYRRNLRRLRRKLTTDIGTKILRKKLETTGESVEWFNMFLSKFWRQYEPGLSQSISESLNAVLEASKPTFLDDLKFSQFTLGSEAPRIDGIRLYPHADMDTLMMDWDLVFAPIDEDSLSKREKERGDKRNSKIELTARIGKAGVSIPLPILLTEVELRGTMYVGIKFMSMYPHIHSIELAFKQKPVIDFILRPLKGMDLMDVRIQPQILVLFPV